MFYTVMSDMLAFGNDVYAPDYELHIVDFPDAPDGTDAGHGWFIFAEEAAARVFFKLPPLPTEETTDEPRAF